MRSATSQFTDSRAQYERCKASPGRLGALYATQQVRRRNAFAQEVIESYEDEFLGDDCCCDDECDCEEHGEGCTCEQCAPKDSEESSE
jgi:hypothetical protein